MESSPHSRLSMLISSRPTTPPDSPPPPPHTAPVSVPFKWEEAPGKPRQPCHVDTNEKDSNRSLELPPRLLFLEYSNSNNKVSSMDVPSPTTVLAGPYVGRAMSFTTSYRTPRDTHNSFSTFGSARFPTSTNIPHHHPEGTFDFFPPHHNKKVKFPRRYLSLSNNHPNTNSHFWASIYESFKQMVPWKRKQEKQRKRAY
ncbi:hypothetical protein HN51_018125 [Arachis hypogaea]|uniref:Uncharacterized protein n=1 Tax=Arachis hypogaea TaxID=3818 RepID=A0A445BSG5_ARAHY|nr:uncharacterized protein LOC112705896 [Arachis hypogaea]QHO29710.1 uncharacterized protein DS421_8g227290 [Arachis hypogaea]RYR41592.1 hypothetical protein Ahy_A08g037998 [Arachis hypogaea]